MCTYGPMGGLTYALIASASGDDFRPTPDPTQSTTHRPFSCIDRSKMSIATSL